MLTRTAIKQRYLMTYNCFKDKNHLCKLQCFSFGSTKQRQDQKTNYYKLLNLKKDCSFQEIKQGYLAASKIYHPDALKSQEKQISQQNPQQRLVGTQDMFIEIQKAFNTLNNPKTRKKHDLELGINQSHWERQHYFASSKNLQNQQFDKILNMKLEIGKIQVGNNSHQSLINKYGNQLDSLTVFQKVKGIWLYFVLFGVTWSLWYSAQNIIMGYQGYQGIEISQVNSDKKLSIVPINFK